MTPSSQICADLYKLADKHNGANLVRELNGVEVFIIQRFEDADYVLRRKAANYRKNMAWLRQMLGASRFTEDGQAWELRRALTQTYFNKFDREKAFQLARYYALRTIDHLVSDSQSRPTIDDDLLRTMTSSVLIDNFFGVRLEDTAVDLSLLAQLMEFGAQYSFIPQGKTGSLYREQLLKLPDLRKKILQMLSSFREEKTTRTPLLDDLLDADKRSDDKIVLEQELIAFIAAGSETSAATMGWVCYLLAKYPEVQERLRPIAQTFWTHGPKDWQTLSGLDPLARFISEALRLYPPTPIVARYAKDHDQLGTTTISAGQNIMVSFIGIQHDRRFRPDPWVLDVDMTSAHKASGETMAFSIGPRICGGKQFALLELVTFLSVFLIRARFELTSEDPPVYFWKSQMLRQGGQPVRVVEFN